MNIRKNHGYLIALNSKEDQHFYNIYKKNPDEFMKVCKCELMFKHNFKTKEESVIAWNENTKCKCVSLLEQ